MNGPYSNAPPPSYNQAAAPQPSAPGMLNRGINLIKQQAPSAFKANNPHAAPPPSQTAGGPYPTASPVIRPGNAPPPPGYNPGSTANIAPQTPLATQSSTSKVGGFVSNVGNQLGSYGTQLKGKVANAVNIDAVRNYARPLLGDRTEIPAALKEPEAGGETGMFAFLKRQAAKGRQLIPNIRGQKGEDGDELVEVSTKDFNLQAFEAKQSGCCGTLQYFLVVVSTFSYFMSFASDLYAAYGLFVDQGVPRGIFGVYLVIVIISWILGVADLSLARTILEQDDLSATIIDDLASRMYQSRGRGHYGLVTTVMENFGFKEKALFNVVSGLQNGKRMVLVVIPQTIVLIVALQFRNKNAATSLVSYALNFLSLSMDLLKLWTVLVFYSCIRCCFDKSMSLWDNLNLRVEKTLNKLLKKHPEYAAVEPPSEITKSIYEPSAPPAEGDYYSKYN